MGGLGIKKARSKNLALLTSLAWRLINTKSLWTQIIASKYANTKNKNQPSFIWKSILRGWYYCNIGTRWDINKTALLAFESQTGFQM